MKIKKTISIVCVLIMVLLNLQPAAYAVDSAVQTQPFATVFTASDFQGGSKAFTNFETMLATLKEAGYHTPDGIFFGGDYSDSSANTDANRRLAMFWGDEDTIKNPTGTTYDAKKQTNGTVADQLADEASLLHYYGKLMSLRKQYPEIARGDYKALDFGENTFGGFLITYNEGKTVLLHNTSTEEVVIDLTSCSDFPAELKKIAAYIGQGEASLKGSTLTLGPQTSVISQ